MYASGNHYVPGHSESEHLADIYMDSAAAPVAFRM